MDCLPGGRSARCAGVVSRTVHREQWCHLWSRGSGDDSRRGARTAERGHGQQGQERDRDGEGPERDVAGMKAEAATRNSFATHQDSGLSQCECCEEQHTDRADFAKGGSQQ